MFRARSALSVVVISLLVVAACGRDDGGGPTPGPSPTPTSGPAPLVVGSIASTSGSGAAYGTGQLRGQELAIELLAPAAGIEVTLVNEDDGSDTARAVEAMEAVLDAGAAAVLGPTLSPVAQQADHVAQAAGVPVLAVTNTTLDIDAIGDVVWRVSLSEEAMIPEAVGASAAAHQLSSAALLHDRTDGYATGAAEAFRSGAADHGVALVADVGFDPGGEGALEALREAAGAAPGALFLAARGGAATELLLGAASLGLDQPRVGGNGFNSAEVLAAAGGAAEGLVVAASWNVGLPLPDSRAFVDAYRSRYGGEPDAFAAQGFAGVQLLLAAVAAGGGTAPGQVLDGLASMGTVPTVLGEVRFDGREARYPAAVQVVEGGRFVLL